jgi:exodeoxyribonuclease V beta subunit
VSHLGFVMLGLAAMTVTGLSGGVLQMVNHGISTGALFLLVGVLYERRHTRMFADYGGIDLINDFPDRLGRLTFSLTKGFMKGYIDMVFHDQNRFWLVDWKSNYLGSSVENYSKNVLKNVMKRHFYILQYHLYVVALHQYLRLRIPKFNYEQHFGGVFYLFLRGVDLDKGPEFGVYKDFPGKTLIDVLLR